MPIQIEAHDDVALVRIDHPPANAMDFELLETGNAIREQLERDEPGAVVITGRERFFSAGVDLKLAPTLDADGQRRLIDGINRLFAGWYAFPRPVVCAVNGHAIAGGLILALCGDHRVCSTEGRIGLTELRAGIPYPAAAIAAVRHELSPQAARILVLGADLIDTTRAHQLGVFDEIATPGEVVHHALAHARGLAALPRSAYSRIKQQLRGEAIDEMRRAVEADPLRDGWFGGESAGAAAAILARD
jgi:enoyl-CoA hydratase